MENIKQARFLGFTLLAAGVAMPILAQLNKPTIIEFDAPGAGTGAYQGTIALDMNPAGAIVGYYFTGSGAVGGYGFVRTPDGNFQRFSVPTAYFTYPESINPEGEVAGFCFNDLFGIGFLRAPDGDLTVFEVPGAGTGSGQGTFPWDINAAGAIAGTYVDGNGVSHGFVRAPGGAITTFDVPGAGTGANQGTYMASQEGLGEAGAIAGWYIDSNSVNHGYLRGPDGTITALDAPGAGTGADQGTLAYGINPAGEIPGVYYDGNNVLHGFLRYPGGKFVAIDVPGATGTQVENINTFGVIDGNYYDAHGASHGFARAPGGTIVRFDAPGAGTASGQGTSVGANNASGEVPGYYTDENNVFHGFLWKP